MNLILSIIVGLVAIGGTWMYLSSPVKPPLKLHDEYWGPGEPPKTVDKSVRPFKINFEKTMVDDLKHRLKNTRELQPSLENVAWTYGFNSINMPQVINYWLNEYDFKKREAYINQYPQFITNIQGLDIHFIHIKPVLPKNRKVEVLPMYMQHGWPGSVLEFHKIIPMLTTPRPDKNFVFELVMPSLPGFGYSDAAAKPGLGAVEVAHLMKNLMLRLGFEKYYTQGGDWGGTITAHMAALYPQHVLGMHSNFCFLLQPWTLMKIFAYSFIPSLLPEDDQRMMFPVSDKWAKLLEITGYLHEQATRPDTLGVGLSDSPAGLAAYILEKFVASVRPTKSITAEGNLQDKFTMDELIDNLMVYWAPNKITSSCRIYAETLNKRSFGNNLDSVSITVPSACAQFPNEIIFHSAVFLRDRFKNLVQTTKMPRGGHFAAMEEPQLLADDVYAAIQKMRDLDAAKENEKLKS